MKKSFAEIVREARDDWGLEVFVDPSLVVFILAQFPGQLTTPLTKVSMYRRVTKGFGSREWRATVTGQDGHRRRIVGSKARVADWCVSALIDPL